MPLKLLRATQSWPGHKVIFLMSIVVRFSFAKTTGSRNFKTLTIARVLHFGPPAKILAFSIWLKRNGVNQLWYVASLGWWVAFRPGGFRVFALNFLFVCCSGLLNSATEAPWWSKGIYCSSRLRTLTSLSDYLALYEIQWHILFSSSHLGSANLQLSLVSSSAPFVLFFSFSLSHD